MRARLARECPPPSAALFIPSLWWHQVQGLDAANALVNWWWRRSPEWLDSPTQALWMAMATVRDLPAAERDQLLPRTDIAPGDVVLGLASSGVHSNGYSLVRKIMERAPHDAKALMEPTRIYVKPLLTAIRSTGAIKGLAHITGGGLPGNVPRCLPDNTRARLDARKWMAPDVFSWLKKTGGVPTDDMLRTFNCGLGMIVVVGKADVARVGKALAQKLEEVSLELYTRAAAWALVREILEYEAPSRAAAGKGNHANARR